MRDESGEAKPVDGAPVSAPAAPAPPVPAPVRIDAVPTPDGPVVPTADPAVLPEVPPAAVTTMVVEVAPAIEEALATPDADEPVAEAVSEAVDVVASIEATPEMVEAPPPIDPAPVETVPVAALPAPGLTAEPLPAEATQEPAPAEPPADLPTPVEAAAEPQPEPAPIAPVLVPSPVVRERRSVLPMLEFAAWRLLELVATVAVASVLIGLLLPSEDAADAAILAERLGVTVPLVVLGLIVAAIVGLPIGYAAARAGSWLDVALRAVTTLGVSLNPIWLAMLLVLLLALTLQWAQPGGFVPWQQSPLAALTSLFLPALALGLPLGAEIASRLRDSFAATLNSASMRTADVMGLGRAEAIRDHALRRALAGLFGQLSIPLALLAPMSLVVESVFYLPGLGRLIFTALADRDFAALQQGLVTLVALVALCRFLGHMLQAWIDPRLARRA